jgi:hypothetical protein
MSDEERALPILKDDTWLWNRLSMMPKGTPRLDALRIVIRECDLESDKAERTHLIMAARAKAAREAFDKLVASYQKEQADG